ncbi:MAG: FAD-dependent oxidoreductase [Halanaerobiales bacterium]|nr:FAD-dependent oxidoreductase [Halanaerobiales bacterium]
MENFNYDLIVIGAGGAGITASLTSIGMGKKVALIERNKIGGECTWSGCVSSKALIKAAHVVNEVRNISKYGLEIMGEYKVDTGPYRFSHIAEYQGVRGESRRVNS